MPGNFKREDLRIIKTHKALISAMSKLLELRNFNQITVHDLCEEALISRATFYSHFQDKYGLLKYWLSDIKSKSASDQYTYEDIEKNVNTFASNYKKTIKNLVENANGETSELLCDFLLSLSNIDIKRADRGQFSPNEVVQSCVYCGGMLNYLLWQVNNKFPPEVPVMNPYIYNILLNYQSQGGGRQCAMDCKFAEKERQLRSLMNGKGIQYLVNEAYKIFGNPLSIHDMEDKTLAYSENVNTDDPYWNECVTKGTVSNETLALFRTEYFICEIANAKIVTSLVSDKLKYDRIFGKIFINDNFRVANLSMMACNKPFEDGDPVMFEEFCKILSNEFSISEFYQNYGTAYQETLIEQLIDESYKVEKYYSARVEDIYKGLKNYLYLAIADITDSEYTDLVRLKNLLRRTQPAFKYAIYANNIAIITSSDNASFNIERDLNKLYRLFEQNKINVGISSHFENLFELHKYYIEAVDALEYGRANHQRIYLYDEIRQNHPEY